jgi:hypothetical protein
MKVGDEKSNRDDENRGSRKKRNNSKRRGNGKSMRIGNVPLIGWGVKKSYAMTSIPGISSVSLLVTCGRS